MSVASSVAWPPDIAVDAAVFFVAMELSPEVVLCTDMLNAAGDKVSEAWSFVSRFEVVMI